MPNVESPIAICPHLPAQLDEYCVWFTGVGTDCYWVCSNCAVQYPALPPKLIAITEELFKQCQKIAIWDGICGTPEFKNRESSIRFDHKMIAGSTVRLEEWIEVQPNLQSNGEWIVLLRSGEIAATNPRDGIFTILHRIDELGFEIDGETGFCLSPSSDYCAIFQTSGQRGCVVDLATGAMTVRLDRGGYRPENSHFPVTFFEHNRRTLLVCATDWNRLDILDPRTGTVLTSREPTSYTSGESRPEHYLDYFHGQIIASPNGHWIADNGWVWHPWGLVRTWSLPEWLEQNPWESEDGLSVKSVADRAYYWDGPICWIDDSTIAVWGWGKDDEWLLPAVQLVDVHSGNQLSWFPGPETRRPRAWPPKKLAPSLFFDRYLFAVSDEQGMTAWDITSGERLFKDRSLNPIGYHPDSKDFLSVKSGELCLSRMIE